jgi:hypothetical protein
VLAWGVPAAGAAVVASRSPGVQLDAPMFVQAGRVLLSSHWSRAFSLSAVQVGPLQLALFGSVGRSSVALAVVLATATALLMVTCTRVVGVTSEVLLGGTGLLAVGVGLTAVGYSTGHPADATLPLIWILAGADARRGHVRRAGLLVGLCAGLETWGILGVAMLALAPRRREAGVGVLVAAAAALALFVPFMLAGHFAMLGFHWHVHPPSPLSVLVPSGTAFGWPLRLAQGVLSVSAGAAVARRARRSPHVLWAAPLAVVAVRLLLDPLLLSYYLAAPQELVFVGAALGASRLIVLRRMRRAPASGSSALADDVGRDGERLMLGERLPRDPRSLEPRDHRTGAVAADPADVRLLW